ncbi:MAG: hypothetical protein FWG34_06580 [Oscillospiraceae bacterium]|nr:hypothetical protein [Oscillospiraceae bacterium]
MIVSPIKKYAPPKYPTQARAILDPGLLAKLPPRWQKNAAVFAAAGMLGAIALSSCGIFGDKDTGYSPEGENYLNVAPIFMHGGGTGSIGCDMVAPPVFLSEQEALAIIKSEAESGGLKFGDKPPEYVATKNKSETEYSWERENKFELGDGSVALDLYDGKAGVAASYVSMKSAEEIYPNGPWSSVTGYQPKRLAELSAEDFAGQMGDIAVGVFYDPGVPYDTEEHQQILSQFYSDMKEYDYNEARMEYEAEAKLLMEADLRAQVRDFIEWLQGQGII